MEVNDEALMTNDERMPNTQAQIAVRRFLRPSTLGIL
jgi:hypothetical protein